MTYKLYEHQDIDVERIRKEYRAGAQSVLHVAPCGYGKTVVFSYIAESAHKKGKSVLVLSHRRPLIKNISDEFKNNKIRHGIIAPGYPSIPYKIQIASVQTLTNRLGKWPYFDMVIGDEIHHLGAKTWNKIKDHFCNQNTKTKFYGCTATPLYRGYGMGEYFDTMVLGPSYKYLIDTTNPQTGRKFLSTPVYYIPSHVNLDDIKKSMGDFNKKQLSKRMKEDRYIMGDAIEMYSKKFEYKPALLYCINIEEAIENEKNWRKAGYKALAIHSKMDYSIVEKGVEDLKNGKLHVLISCDMIGEGANIPRVEVIIEQRPTDSIVVNDQHQGRGLRSYPGKTYSYHMDQVGNCVRHGFIDWPKKWELTKEKFVPVIAKVKTCDFCFAAYPSNMKKCPYCGHIKPVKKRESNIDIRPGELKKIDYRELNENIKKADSITELKKIAEKVGYRQGWINYQWENKKKKEKVEA